MRRILPVLAVLVASVFLASAPHAAAAAKKHHILLQWTEVDTVGQWAMTKHVGNLLDDLGQDNVQLEVIAYGAATFAVSTSRPQTLQAKAIDGLAYLKSDSGDKMVFEAIAKHPSRIVRAEAIAAYLWNHDGSDRAKEALKPYVHKEELIFLDRVTRVEGEKKESFNRKLEAYLKTHPEMQAPAPTKAQPGKKPTVGEPPAF